MSEIVDCVMCGWPRAEIRAIWCRYCWDRLLHVRPQDDWAAHYAEVMLNQYWVVWAREHDLTEATVFV